MAQRRSALPCLFIAVPGLCCASGWFTSSERVRMEEEGVSQTKRADAILATHENSLEIVENSVVIL
jgi:hypothetical protein